MLTRNLDFHSVRRTLPFVSLVAVAVLTAAAPTGTKRSEVRQLGAQQASLYLDRSWIPMTANAGSAVQTWVTADHEGVITLYVMEIPGLFIEQADFENELEPRIADFVTISGEQAERTDVRFRRRSRLGVAQASVFGTSRMLPGLRTHAEFRLIGREGLAYMAVVVGEESQASDVRSAAQRAVDGFRMPDGGSEWSRGLVPSRVTGTRFGRSVSVEVAPSVLETFDVDGWLWGVGSADGRFSAVASMEALVAVPSAPPSPRQTEELDALIERMVQTQWEDSLFEGRRRWESVEWAGCSGRQLTLTHTELEQEYFIEAFALRVDAETVLGLQMVSAGGTGAHRELRRALMGSLTIGLPLHAPGHGAGPAGGLAEELAGAPQPGQIGPDPALLSVLSRSQVHGELSPGEWIRGAEVRGEELYLFTSQRVLRVDESSEWLAPESQQKDALPGGSYARTRAAWLSVQGGELVRLEGKTVVPLGIKADRVATFSGDVSVVVRTFGMEGGNALADLAPSRSLVTFLNRSGTNDLLYETSAEVLDLGVYGPDVLLATSSKEEIGLVYEPVLLYGTEAGRPAALRLGPWRVIYAVRPAPEGWLVTGSPSGRAEATYLITPSGRSERVIEGRRVDVLAVIGQRVFFSLKPVQRSRIEDGLGRSIFSAPLEDLQKDPLFCSPWSPVELGILGRAAGVEGLLASSALSSGADSSAWVTVADRADELSLRIMGAAFPTHADGLDQLLSTCGTAPDLDRDGRRLLTALAIRHLKKAGARWAGVPPAAPASLGPASIAPASIGPASTGPASTGPASTGAGPNKSARPGLGGRTHQHVASCLYTYGVDLAGALGSFRFAGVAAPNLIRQTLEESGGRELWIGIDTLTVRERCLQRDQALEVQAARVDDRAR